MTKKIGDNNALKEQAEIFLNKLEQLNQKEALSREQYQEGLESFKNLVDLLDAQQGNELT